MLYITYTCRSTDKHHNRGRFRRGGGGGEGAVAPPVIRINDMQGAGVAHLQYLYYWLLSSSRLLVAVVLTQTLLSATMYILFYDATRKKKATTDHAHILIANICEWFTKVQYLIYSLFFAVMLLSIIQQAVQETARISEL